MWVWRSVSSFLNGRNEALNKADSVFCPTAQGQISFFLPSFPRTPSSFVQQPSSSVICYKPQRKLGDIKIHFFSALCLSFFFSRHWIRLKCGQWIARIPCTQRYCTKKKKNTQKGSRQGVHKHFLFWLLYLHDLWKVPAANCDYATPPNKVICHHPKDWPDRQTAINWVQRPKRSILAVPMFLRGRRQLQIKLIKLAFVTTDNR